MGCRKPKVEILRPESEVHPASQRRGSELGSRASRLMGEGSPWTRRLLWRNRRGNARPSQPLARLSGSLPSSSPSYPLGSLRRGWDAGDGVPGRMGASQASGRELLSPVGGAGGVLSFKWFLPLNNWPVTPPIADSKNHLDLSRFFDRHTFYFLNTRRVPTALKH